MNMKSMIYEDHSVKDMDGHTSVGDVIKVSRQRWRQRPPSELGRVCLFTAAPVDVCLWLMEEKKKKIKMQIRTDAREGFIASSLLIYVVEKT